MCTLRDDIMLSVIAPAFNEADCLRELVNAIQGALLPLQKSFEIILVDDASTDGTRAVIQELAETFSEVKGCYHSVNSGQSAAVVTGFHAAQGRLLVTLDADMQNPPAEILRLLTHLTPETDAVCGVRTQRNDRMIRRFSSRVANVFRNWITGISVQDAGCGLRLIRRSAVQEFPVFNGLHRFITTILQLQGFTVKEIPVEHSARFAGESKYGIQNRLWRGVADCFAMRWYAARVVPANRLKGEA